MYKNLRWKLLGIFVVLALFFSVGVYPLLAQHFNWPLHPALQARSLKLGLDLKGGVQLELRVNTDDALRISTTSTSEQLRDSLRNATVPFGNITVDPKLPTTFRVD